MIPTEFDEISLEAMQDVNDTCDAFDRQWNSYSQASEEPALRIAYDEFKKNSSNNSRKVRVALWKSLVAIDVAARKRWGLSYSKKMYQSLIPDDLRSKRKAGSKGKRISSGHGETASIRTPKLLEKDRDSDKRQSFGPYKVLEKIGQGGMGEVYLAEQTEPVWRRVALKIVKSESPSSEVLARFEAERQALAMMDHNNIAKVYDAGCTENGLPYFAMELIKGEPITKFCDDNKLSTSDRLDLFKQTCQAINHAHQKGIIHRDIKPSNVLVALYEGQPVVKVIDFGLAKAIQSSNRLTDRTLYTNFGQILGTFSYMSPEQVDTKAFADLDTRADVYSLGVILFELLTGSTPIDQDSLQGMAIDKLIGEIRDGETPKPSNRLRDSSHELQGILERRDTDSKSLLRLLQGDLDWVVIRALEKDRGRRYQSVSELLDDIQRFQNNEPVDARAPEFRYRFYKFARKYRAPLAVAALCTAILCISLFAVTRFWLKADAEAKRAVSAETEMRDARDDAEQATESALRQSNFYRQVSYGGFIQQAFDETRYYDTARTIKSLEGAQKLTNPKDWDFRLVGSVALEKYHRSTLLHSMNAEQRERVSNCAQLLGNDRAVVGWKDGRITIVGLSGEEFASRDTGKPIQDVAISPQDASLLFATTEDGHFLQLKLPSLEVLSNEKVTNEYLGRMFVTGNDGSLLIGTGLYRPNFVTRRDSSGKFLKPFDFGERISDLYVETDSETFYCGTESGKIVQLQLDESESGFSEKQRWETNFGNINAIAVTGEEEFAIVGKRPVLAFFDAKRDEISRELPISCSDGRTLRVDKDRKWAAIVGMSREMALVNLETDEQFLFQISHRRFIGTSDVDFHLKQDGKIQLIVAGAQLAAYEFISRQPIVDVFKPDGNAGARMVELSENLASVCIKGDGTADEDGLVLIDSKTNEEVFRKLGFHPRFSRISPDENIVVVNFTHNSKRPLFDASHPNGAWVNAMLVFKKQNGGWTPKLLGINPGSNINVAAFSRRGNLVTVDDDLNLKLWDVDRNELKTSFKVGEKSVVNAMFIDDDIVALQSEDGLRFWSLGEKKLIETVAGELLHANVTENTLLCIFGTTHVEVAFEESADFALKAIEKLKTLVASLNDEKLNFPNANETWQDFARFSKRGAVRVIGSRAIATHPRGELILWDIENWVELLRFNARQGGVWGFGVGGETVYTCGFDGTVKAWHPFKIGEEIEGVWPRNLDGEQSNQ